MPNTPNVQDRTAPGPRYASTGAIAIRWGTSDRHIRNLIDERVLPHIRFGGSIRVPIDAVEAYEAEHFVAANGGATA
jgi:excisionase family DNA binding protein